VWEFEYDTSSRLKKIHYPTDSYVSASNVQVTYAFGDRLATITSRDSKIWTYAYAVTTYKISRVDDPGPAGSPYQQFFSFAATPSGGLYENTYTDRRGKVWKMRFDSSTDDLRQFTNPNTSSNTQYYTYDSSHNRLTAENELGKTWTNTYGSYGRLLTATTPISGQTWTYTWQQPDPTNKPNFWRVTKITDPDSDWVEYEYTDTNDPTLVTKIIEKEATTGSGNAQHLLEYFGTGTPKARGQLKKFTDHNGVRHEYTYDKWGYFAELKEGDVPAADCDPGGSVASPCVFTAGNDAAGRQTSGTSPNGGGGGSVGLNVNGNVVVTICPVSPGGPPTRLGYVPSPAVPVSMQGSLGTAGLGT
jgi:hypothetical protein